MNFLSEYGRQNFLHYCANNFIEITDESKLQLVISYRGDSLELFGEEAINDLSTHIDQIIKEKSDDQISFHLYNSSKIIDFYFNPLYDFKSKVALELIRLLYYTQSSLSLTDGTMTIYDINKKQFEYWYNYMSQDAGFLQYLDDYFAYKEVDGKHMLYFDEVENLDKRLIACKIMILKLTGVADSVTLSSREEGVGSGVYKYDDIIQDMNPYLLGVLGDLTYVETMIAVENHGIEEYITPIRSILQLYGLRGVPFLNLKFMSKSSSGISTDPLE